MLLLVPAHPGCPGQNPEICKMAVCVCVSVFHSLLMVAGIWYLGYVQKGKPFWILIKQEIMGWQWHHLNLMQIIYTSLQTTMPTLHHSDFTDQMPLLPPNQQRQSTVGLVHEYKTKANDLRLNSIRSNLSETLSSIATWSSIFSAHNLSET